MPRTAARTSALASRTSRTKLAKRNKPYFIELVPGKVSLGYRLTSSAWLERFYEGAGRYQTKGLGAKADDILDADGKTILNYAQAQERVRQHYAERPGTPAAKRGTVAVALDKYEADLRVRGGDAGNVKRVRRHLPDGLLARAVADLEADELRQWRDSLTKTLKAATVNRTTVGLAASLNHLADLDKMAAANRNSWRTGLKAIAGATRANNVVLPNALVQKLVAQAAEQGDDFHRLVWTQAETGAAFGQVAALQIKDLQDTGDAPRLMMPVRKKGRGTKPVRSRPVPIPASLAAELRKAAGGRPPTEPLLLHAGGAWRPGQHLKLFARTVQAAGLGREVTSYSLRHSSIVRMLLANVPVRVVAAHHDTSVRMIEKTYSAYISDHADSLVRGALLDVTQPAPALTVVQGRP